MTERATIYCRISLDRTGEELGVERQEKECRELAAKLGLEVEQVLVDNDISATTGKRRPAFEELLERRPATAIAWHTDRLVRVSADLERVLDTGMTVHTVTAGWLDLSTPAGRAVARTVTAWATYEGEQKALRQKAAHAQRRASGKPWWPKPPFGYTATGEVVKKEAEAIRQGCLDVLHGKAVAQIAREWERAGFRSHRGNVMRPQSVRQVLMHPRNAGIITSGGYDNVVEHGQGQWEAIIDELTLRAVRAALSDPSRRYGAGSRSDAALLTGLLWCAVCEGRVGSATQHQGGRVYSYYTCRQGKHVNWPREWLETYLTRVTLGVLSRPEWAQGWSGDARDLTELEAEADRLRNLIDVYLDREMEGKITTAQYERVTGKARARLAEIEEELSGAGAVSDAMMLDAAQRAQRWDDLDTDEKREVIRQVFPKILLQRSGAGRGRQPDENAVILSG